MSTIEPFKGIRPPSRSFSAISEDANSILPIIINTIAELSQSILLTDLMFNIIYQNESSKKTIGEIQIPSNITAVFKDFDKNKEVQTIQGLSLKIIPITCLAYFQIEIKKNENHSLERLAHDIRAAAVPIGYYLEKIKKDPSKAEIYLDTIEKCHASIIDITEDMLSPQNEKNFFLSDFIKKIHVMTVHLNGNIKLHFNVARELPDLLYGFETALLQILINLIRNSYAHAFKKDETGNIYVNFNVLDMNETNIHIAIEVIDDGHGIEKKYLLSFMEESVSSKTILDKHFGIGMSCITHLSKKINAKFSLVSSYNEEDCVKDQNLKKGTFFKLETNISIPTLQKIKSSIHLMRKEDTKILVIEDNTLCSHMIKKSLMIIGYTNITMLSKSSEGLAQLANENFEILITDIFTGEDDICGFDVVEKFIEKNPNLPKNSIYIFTSDRSEEVLTKCNKYSAQLLPKEVNPKIVRKFVGATPTTPDMV